VNAGVLYPPLHNGDFFGGTRYMPLQFTAHAGIARLTGEYLVSGKLFAYATAVGLYLVAFFVYRSISRSTVLAAGLVAAVLASGTGLEAATTVRGDAVPAALQLGALATVASRSRRATVGAAVLCSLAFVSKLSAVWAAIAIVIWLAFGDRGRLRIFVITYLGSLVALLGLFELLSHGRMLEQLVQLGAAGELSSFSPTAYADKVVRAFEESGAAWLLAPFAAASIWVAVSRRRLTPYHVAALVALPVVLFVLTDVGAYRNHLLDLQLLTAALVADLCAVSSAADVGVVRLAILAAVLVGTLASYETDVLRDARDAARSLYGTDTYTSMPLAGVVGPNDRILSEDPYIPVSRGQLPLVVDAFMLRRIGEDHPSWRDDLVVRIERRRFSKVVLVNALTRSNDWWWHNFDFGTPVAAALTANYRLLNLPRYYATAGHLWVYVPRGRSS